MAEIPRPPVWDRFGVWSPLPARAMLAAIIALLALATLPHWANSSNPVPASTDAAAPSIGSPMRDEDLELYDRIIERVGAGDPYYASAIAEQRARNFPVRPGVAVRLPTLAWTSASLGPVGVYGAAVLLWLGLLIAWWRRLGTEPGATERRIIALLLLAVGTAIALKPPYLSLHEVWAGGLLALSFALHRPGHWVGSFAAASLALAIREHALPFVLLMGACALWARRWKELIAWSLLVAAFAVGLVVHLSVVSEYLTPQDRPSPSWLAFRGLEGFTSAVMPSSVLYLAPPILAAPATLLPLIGWAGWRSAVGSFGTMFYAGYAVFLMLAGRENNFYWALVITPAYFVGLIFLPMALRSLWRSARSARAIA